LNNWYIRRSRERIWAPGQNGGADASHDAFDTLHTVLVTLMKIAAPLLPMLTEEIHIGLTGERYIHLTDWPDPADLPTDPELVRAMDEVRAVCSTGLGLREDEGLRQRLPLPRLSIAGPRAEALRPFTGLIAQELNVREVELTDDRSGFGTEVIRPNPRVLGPRLGKDVQAVLAAARSGDWTRDEDGTPVVGGHRLA